MPQLELRASRKPPGTRAISKSLAVGFAHRWSRQSIGAETHEGTGSGKFNRSLLCSRLVAPRAACGASCLLLLQLPVLPGQRLGTKLSLCLSLCYRDDTLDGCGITKRPAREETRLLPTNGASRKRSLSLEHVDTVVPLRPLQQPPPRGSAGCTPSGDGLSAVSELRDEWGDGPSKKVQRHAGRAVPRPRATPRRVTRQPAFTVGLP
ncbi:unnamed protein product [Lampetra planeri]